MKNLATNHKAYYGVGAFAGVFALLSNFVSTHCAVSEQEWLSFAIDVVPAAILAMGAYFHGKAQTAQGGQV